MRKKSKVLTDGYFDMPAVEKDAFHALNLLRTDPALFIELLNDTKGKFNGD
jgi:hypothetical protein